MRKRLQIALMVSPVLAASFSLSVPRAFGASDGKETPSRLIATTDDSGRTIYTNDSIAATPARAEREGEALQTGPPGHHGRSSLGGGRSEPLPEPRSESRRRGAQPQFSARYYASEPGRGGRRD